MRGDNDSDRARRLLLVPAAAREHTIHSLIKLVPVVDRELKQLKRDSVAWLTVHPPPPTLLVRTATVTMQTSLAGQSLRTQMPGVGSRGPQLAPGVRCSLLPRECTDIASPAARHCVQINKTHVTGSWQLYGGSMARDSDIAVPKAAVAPPAPTQHLNTQHITLTVPQSPLIPCLLPSCSIPGA